MSTSELVVRCLKGPRKSEARGNRLVKGNVAGFTDGSRCRKLHFELEIFISVNEVMMQEIIKTFQHFRGDFELCRS